MPSLQYWQWKTRITVTFYTKDKCWIMPRRGRVGLTQRLRRIVLLSVRDDTSGKGVQTPLIQDLLRDKQLGSVKFQKEK
jgi:hypothetical protein